MNDSQLKSNIRNILKSVGLEFIPIPEQPDRRTPDFRIVGDSDKYTVELKTKHDDLEKLKERDDVLNTGKMYESSEPVGPRNTIHSKIKDGVKQLTAEDEDGETYRILWMHCSGSDEEFQSVQIKNTLYGLETLISLDGKGVMYCHYYHESAFFTHRHTLDGAIITYGNNLFISINTLSSKSVSFRDSELIRAFDGAIYNPDSMEGLENGVLIADCPIDRKNQEEINQFLCKKYNLAHIQAVPMQKHSAEIKGDVNRGTN